MRPLVKAFKNGDEKGFAFWCPGCDEPHTVRIKPNGWRFNGSLTLPTFDPSVLVRSGHYAGSGCWCEYDKKQLAAGKEPSRFKCSQCHSFIKEGKIQFLADCSHHLAGTTVDIPPWPYSETET